MNKRYQIFISSTYQDLIKEREKVIETILGLDQFPAGMELFEASDKEQWELIKDTIDDSDYYVLIIRWKYGSIFKDGKDTGISYTEKEFDYAVSKGVPVLAFIIADDVPHTNNEGETDPDKAASLIRFVTKVKEGRTVKFWHNADELANLLSRSLIKGIRRGNRPGWVRTTEFDIEKSHAEILRLTERVHQLEAINAELKFEQNRKPELRIEVRPGVTSDGELLEENLQITSEAVNLHVLPVEMRDAERGIIYKDQFGAEIYVHREDVRKFRYVCKNAFLLQFRIYNKGDARATGVRLQILFPKELAILSEEELLNYLRPDDNDIPFSDDAYENWNQRFYEQNIRKEEAKVGLTDVVITEICDDENRKFISREELATVGDIANLLDPAYKNECISIFPGEVRLKKHEILHKSWDAIDGVYVLPTMPGEFNVRCRFICDEYPNIKTQDIRVVVN